jgi:hypothetical protein
MKFSDMMGKRDRRSSEVTEPPRPPEAATAPPVPEAPVRFGGNRSELDEAAAAFGTEATTREAAVAPPAADPATFVAAPPPIVEPDGPLSISDVVAELAPRPVAAVTDQQLDTSAWLDGINSIDDDLLPR